jgi:hypothetical protein
MSNLYSRWCTDCLVSLGYIPHVYLTCMEHQIHRTTPPHTLLVLYLWFFFHNRQCSPDLCVIFSTVVSIYTNFPTSKQPPDHMLNQICTSHIVKIRFTTYRISRTQHLKRVNIMRSLQCLLIAYDQQHLSNKCTPIAYKNRPKDKTCDSPSNNKELPTHEGSFNLHYLSSALVWPP